MTHTSCIQHPPRNPYIQLHEWQVRFCRGNQCAALLLSHFSSWHDWKLKNDEYYRRFNDIAEAHGDGRPHNEGAYLFFSMNALIDALMGLFGKTSILSGIDFLVSIGVISVHKNPNPRYYFDKTKYFKFYPEVCNRWIQKDYSKHEDEENDSQPIDNFDSSKTANAFTKNSRPSSENGRPSSENGNAITDNTNNTTNKKNKNKSINAGEDLIETVDKSTQENSTRALIQPIVDGLLERGMSPKRLYPDSLDEITHLVKRGVTLPTFIKAFEIAEKATQGNAFGIAYLSKVIESQFKSSRGNPRESPMRKKDDFSKTVYESDFTNVNWMKGGNSDENATEDK